jgi:hypothetical protein
VGRERYGRELLGRLGAFGPGAFGHANRAPGCANGTSARAAGENSHLVGSTTYIGGREVESSTKVIQEAEIKEQAVIREGAVRGRRYRG